MQTKVLSLTLSLGKRNWTSTTVCITTTIIITILVVSIRVFFSFLTFAITVVMIYGLVL